MPLLWSATGRVFLGLLDDQRVQALAEAELQAATPEQRALLDARDPLGPLRAAVRADGCAAVRDTNLKGISAVAAPVRDYTGRVCAVLTALAPRAASTHRSTGRLAVRCARKRRR